MSTQGDTFVRADGLGERYLINHPHRGLVEVLDVHPALVQQPGLEVLIGRRAAQTNAAAGAVAHTHLVERRGAGIRVTAEHPDGIRLSELLRFMERLPGRVPTPAVLAIALALTRALSVLHTLPGRLAHGAITPEHAVLRSDGTVVLTDAALADVFAGLDVGRKRLWSTFGLIMPAAAGQPHFDQRADVTQMAGVVLQLAIGRALSVADSLRLPELVASVMSNEGRAGLGPAAQFRGWLHRALQLPSRGVFASGDDAEQALARVLGQMEHPPDHRSIRALVHKLAVTPMGEASPSDPLLTHTRSA
jgi:hypothetical protein